MPHISVVNILWNSPSVNGQRLYQVLLRTLEHHKSHVSKQRSFSEISQKCFPGLCDCQNTLEVNLKCQVYGYVCFSLLCATEVRNVYRFKFPGRSDVSTKALCQKWAHLSVVTFLGIPEHLSRKNAHTVTVLFLLKSPVIYRWIQNCEIVFQLVSNFAILDQKKNPPIARCFTFIIINVLRGEMKISTVSVL